MKPHQYAPHTCPPLLHPDPSVNAGIPSREALHLSETAGAVISHIAYTDSNLAIFTDKGIVSFHLDSGDCICPIGFYHGNYPLSVLQEAGLVSQQVIDSYLAKSRREQVDTTKERELRLYLSLKEKYDRGELQPPTPTPDPSGA